MPERVNFTKKLIADQPPAPPGKRVYLHDSRVVGLLVQITATGHKSFQVLRRKNTRYHRVTLGKFPDMTVEQARRLAEAALGQLAEGIDVNRAKKAERAAAKTLQDVFEDYLAARQLKPITITDYRKAMRGFDDWHELPLTRINRDMVARRHARLGKRSPAQANMAMRLLRALFNFAIGEYEDADGNALITDNPVRRISHNRAWFRIDRRRGHLHDWQFRPWFEACEAITRERGDFETQTLRDYLVLVLLTGIRRTDAASIRWAHVDLNNRTLVIPDPKNRDPHMLPLGDYLHRLLTRRQRQTGKSPFVFPGRYGKGRLNTAWTLVQRIEGQTGIHVGIHDLRRTFITTAERLDLSAYAVKRLAGHKMRQDITAGYIVSDIERLRRPMQQVEDFILRACGVLESAAVLDLAEARRDA